jgi:hypothetical protein
MTEENTPKPFDPNLEHLIITILDGTKDDEVGQALTNIGIRKWNDFFLFNSDDTEYLSYKDGNENRELPFFTQKKIKYAIFYYKWRRQDNNPKADFPRLWTSDEFIEWWQGPATRYIAANAATDSFNSNSTQTNPAVKFQQSKDNNNLNNWKKRGSPTKFNSQSPTKFNSQSPHSILKQHEIHHKNSDAYQSAGTALSILHRKAGTEKKNRELEVPHHELKVLQDRFYNASDVPSKTPVGCSYRNIESQWFHLKARRTFHLQAHRMFHLQARRMFHLKACRMFHLQARWMFHLQARRMLNHSHVPHSLRQRLLPHPPNPDILIPMVYMMLIFPTTFSFLLTLNSAKHGHVLTRNLAFLFLTAKQVLERKTVNFRFHITNFWFSRTDFTMRRMFHLQARRMFHLQACRMLHLQTRRMLHLQARRMFHLQARRMFHLQARQMFHLKARWVFHLQARRIFHLQARRIFHLQARRMHFLGAPSASIFAMMGSIVTLMFPKYFSFLATQNSANHGHVLTRKLAFLISIAKQVLERKTMNFRSDITNSRFSRTDFTMRQIHPERKYLVADVPTYQLKVHSNPGILHACYLNPKYECSILEILSTTPLSTLGTLITLNPSAQPPLSSIFAMMGSILIRTVLRHLLGLNSRSRSKTTETLD